MNPRGKASAQIGISYELPSEPDVASTTASRTRQQWQEHQIGRCERHVTIARRSLLLVGLTFLILGAISGNFKQVQAGVLMRVCDTREIKTVTNRVCMLYKRTKNSDIKLDKDGNIRVARGAKGEYSPAKLASDCCKIGCPPHIFALNC